MHKATRYQQSSTSGKASSSIFSLRAVKSPAALYNGSVHQPVISCLSGGRKKMYLNTGGKKTGFLFFSWVWISRNKDNRNYPPTVAECLTLICFILWFCCSTDQKGIAWDKTQKGTVLDRHMLCGRSQASPFLHVAGTGGTPPQVQKHLSFLPPAK